MKDKIVEYYPNGNLKSSVSSKDGVPHGYQKIYYENGELMYEGQMINNTQDGVWKLYYQNGVLKRENVFKNDQKISLKEFDIKGNLIEELDLTSNQQQTKSKSFLSAIINVEEKIKNSWDYVAKSDKKPKLSSENKKSFSEIKKLLNSRDFDKIDEAIEKLVSLKHPELFETLLNGCEIHVSEEGHTKLIKNDFFNGSSPAQPYLNYALFSIIAHAPNESDIDKSLIIKNMTSLNMSLFFRDYDLNSLTKFPSLERFTSLTSLIMNHKIFIEMNVGVNKNISRNDWLLNNKITKLEIQDATGSLKWFKNCCQLKTLKFKFGYYPVEFIESFEYLEKLEELDLDQINYQQKFSNIDFLRKCKRIKKLRLNIASSYSNDPVELENIDVLKNFNELEELEIYGINSNLKLDALLSCEKIKKLTLSQKKYENVSIDLQLLKNCKLLETLELSVSDNLNFYGEILDIDGLKGLSNLKSISLDGIHLSGLDNKVFVS